MTAGPALFAGFETLDIATPEASIHLVRGGSGPPLLLLHGYPQTHVMWHRVAPRLAERFTVIAPDLRGYGDSAKPPGGADHAAYSKRVMAGDQVEVMRTLGFERYAVVGHDRGARVAYRMALDHPQRVRRLATLDIVPTHTTFAAVDRAMAMGTFHWFFLAQPHDLPERLIGGAPEYFLTTLLARWSGSGLAVFDARALAEYVRCFDAATIHATCEDYRAGASLDDAHDAEDLGRRTITCPMLALWGGRRRNRHRYDMLAEWRRWATDVRGHALDCGHFLPEEAPEDTAAALTEFLTAAG
jgi:haloacetate dehalogenase